MWDMCVVCVVCCVLCVVFFQAEDGIRDLVRSRGLGDVYKRQTQYDALSPLHDQLVTQLQVGLLCFFSNDPLTKFM